MQLRFLLVSVFLLVSSASAMFTKTIPRNKHVLKPTRNNPQRSARKTRSRRHRDSNSDTDPKKAKVQVEKAIAEEDPTKLRKALVNANKQSMGDMVRAFIFYELINDPLYIKNKQEIAQIVHEVDSGYTYADHLNFGGFDE